jgi:hypothetical protein
MDEPGAMHAIEVIDRPERTPGEPGLLRIDKSLLGGRAIKRIKTALRL